MTLISNTKNTRTQRAAFTGLTALSLVALALVTIAATACNTVEGAGKDIERGGEKLQGAADGAK